MVTTRLCRRPVEKQDFSVSFALKSRLGKVFRGERRNKLTFSVHASGNTAMNVDLVRCKTLFDDFHGKETASVIEFDYKRFNNPFYLTGTRNRSTD